MAMNENPGFSTEELLRLLFMESSLEHLMKNGSEHPGLPPLPVYLTMLSKRRGEPPERVIHRANIEQILGIQKEQKEKEQERKKPAELKYE